MLRLPRVLVAPPLLRRFLNFSTTAGDEVDRLACLINSHPFPSSPLTPLLQTHLLPSPSLLEPLLRRLSSGGAAASKSLELFKFGLNQSSFPPPSAAAFSVILRTLTRIRAFPAAFSLLRDISTSHPSLLSLPVLAAFLSRHAKFKSFEDTIELFDELSQLWARAKKPFGVDEFNILLRSFCTIRRVGEAKAIFRMLHRKYPPNSRTLNTLLLGFKETGNLMALDIFYHETIVRGFDPDIITYNIRIDAYCKKGRFLDALELLEEMERLNFAPTIETMTTLIHGAGIVHNTIKARRLFDEISDRGLCVDRGAYNALMGAYARSRDLKSALAVITTMEERGIEFDDVSYFTMFWGMKRVDDFSHFFELYEKMIKYGFVPRTRTVMMLMKTLCERGRWDLGLRLWDYLLEKGCCPHSHVLDLLVISLCCRGRVTEAYRCFKQVVERGRQPPRRGFNILEGFLKKNQETEKLEELLNLINMMQEYAHPLQLDKVTT